MSEMIGVREWAKAKGVDERRAARLARQGKFPGAVQVLGRWGVPADTDPSLLPEAKEGIAKAREDGRSRYVVYMSDKELAAVKKMGLEVVDLKAARKARRERKAAAAAAAAKEAASKK